eukprot:COSAG05_NODE_839_length_7033_cov_12.960485_5_plen_161_part_00
MQAHDRFGRPRSHPDFSVPPPPTVQPLLSHSSGEFDWRLTDDTLSHALISHARCVEAPKAAVVYAVMSCTDKRRCFQVIRRYNDFVALSTDMKQDLYFLQKVVAELPELPRAGIFSLLGDTDPESAFVKGRKASLEGYLKEAMGIGAFEKSRSFRCVRRA